MRLHFDLAVAVAGLVVGFTVGLTGMGGGALMTPILVLLFKVQPLAAVSSDLVASVIMKPVGGGVHLRRGTVNFALVKWLMVGSVPAAFAGVLVLRRLGEGAALQVRVREALGVALVAAACSIAVKALLQFRDSRRPTQPEGPAASAAPPPGHSFRARPLATVLVGAAGGLVVGMTSVGSGSLMIVMLMLLYPALRSSELVGTDLVQAVPLVGSAALGHLLFGDFKLALTASLLVGCLPGGLPRSQGLVAGPGRGRPPGAGGHPARLRAQAARPRHVPARPGGGRRRPAGGARPSGLAEADRAGASAVTGAIYWPRLAVLFQQAARAAGPRPAGVKFPRQARSQSRPEATRA